MPQLGSTPRLAFRGPYSAGAAYAVNDLVTYQGSTYIALAAALGVVPTDSSKWSVFAQAGATGDTGTSTQGSQGVQGVKGDTGNTGPAGPGVPTGGASGQALVKNTGTDYDTAWSTIAAGGGGGFNYKGEYNGSTAYAINDAVSLLGPQGTTGGQQLFIAVAASTGSYPNSSMTTPWKPVAVGLNFRGSWVSGTYYPRDVVVYSAATWVQTRTGNASTANAPSNGSTHWTKLGAGINPAGTWSASTAYYPGDIVQYAGSQFLNITATTAGNYAPPNTSYWAALATGSGMSTSPFPLPTTSGLMAAFPGIYTSGNSVVGSGLCFTKTRITGPCRISGIGLWLVTGSGSTSMETYFYDTGGTAGVPNNQVFPPLTLTTTTSGNMVYATFGTVQTVTSPLDLWVGWRVSSTSVYYAQTQVVQSWIGTAPNTAGHQNPTALYSNYTGVPPTTGLGSPAGYTSTTNPPAIWFSLTT